MSMCLFQAISHTFATLFLDPLKHLGKAVAEFNRELFANLPFQAWIPALLSVYGGLAVAVYIFMKCTWSYGRPAPQIIYREMPVSVEPLPGTDYMPRIENVPFQVGFVEFPLFLIINNNYYYLDLQVLDSP